MPLIITRRIRALFPCMYFAASWLVSFPEWADTFLVRCLWYLCRLLHKIGLSLGKEIVLKSFPCDFPACFIVPEAARVTFRTLCFEEQLRAISWFSFAAAVFAFSFSFHSSSLSRSVSSPRIKVPVLNFLRTLCLSRVWMDSDPFGNVS